MRVRERITAEQINKYHNMVILRNTKGSNTAENDLFNEDLDDTIAINEEYV